YRLNVFAIEVPPLRDRREDIIPIANSFLASRGLPAAKLSGGAQQSLLQNPWRGNVRELENALERALILAGSGAVEREHLVGAPAAGPRDVRADDLLTEGFGLDAFERSLIHAAIARAGGNKAAAARLLGITRRRLYSLQSSLERGEREDSED
ncbi:MAG TPA: helix-turn-helix domain-containing protein, partial [Anaeromyxobacteraceae bacterium]